MRDFMDGYYADLKIENGIDLDYGIKKDDSTLALMMGKVKPKITEKNFEDFLAKQTKEIL